MTTADAKHPTDKITRRLNRIQHIRQEIKDLKAKEEIMQHEIAQVMLGRPDPDNVGLEK